MSSVRDDIRIAFASSTVVGKYILASVVVFLLIKILGLLQLLLVNAVTLDPTSFFNKILLEEPLRWFAVPATPKSLLFRPWTLVTYMFTHVGFRHILYNMIMLYFGGRMFNDLLGSKRFIKTYWLGGITGALLFVVAYNLMPNFDYGQSILLGASGSVLAILVGITAYRPDYKVNLIFIGPVKLLYVTAVFIILSLPAVGGHNMGGHLAHLGGALWGGFYGYRLKNGFEHAYWFDQLADYVMAYFDQRSKPKMKTYAGGSARSTQSNTPSRGSTNQQEVDAILDKISKSGYESLSSKEKSILFNASGKKK